MFYRPSLDEIFTAARATVAVLKDLGYDCCFIGGLACVSFGNTRTPEVREEYLSFVEFKNDN